MKVCTYCRTECGDDVQSCPSCGAKEWKHKCPNCGAVFDGNFCPICGVKAGAKAKRCPNCESEYYTNACPNCGYTPAGQQNAVYQDAGSCSPPPQVVYIDNRSRPVRQTGRCNKWVAFFLCFFFGFFGFHKFYEGKPVRGVIYLLTFGLFTFGWLFDCVTLLFKPHTYDP